MNKKEIIKQVNSVILSRKRTAENEAEFYLQTQLKNKDFKQHFVDFKTAKLNLAKAQFENAENLLQVQNGYDKVKSGFENFIKKNNINLNGFVPNYYCKKCNDSGAYKGANCVCFNTLFSEKLAALSGKNLKDLPSFSSAKISLKNTEQEKHLKQVFSVLEKYSANLEAYPKKIITLMGKTGVGKTYGATMMLENAIKHGQVGCFVSAISINNDFLKYHLAPLAEKNAIIANYLHCDLLIIDDLGTEPILKNVTEEYYYLVITERLNGGKNTVITTNLNQEQIREVYGERIFSRLWDKDSATALKLEGDDLRIKGRK